MSEQPENPKEFPHYQASNRKYVGEVGGQPMYQVTDEKAVEGMSLRDYFSAKAMDALILEGHYKISEIPEKAYEIADAMLKERAKK